MSEEIVDAAGALAGADGSSEGGDSIARFATDLRRLRLDADNPTLARLQAETGISRSVLSDAFGGRQLPSARTVDGIVRMCGEDSRSWIERRDALAGRGTAGAGAAAATAAATDAVENEPAPRTASVSRRAAVLLAAGAFVIGVVASALTAILVVPLVSPAAPAVASPATGAARAPVVEVSTGDDPGVTECVEDARVATSATGPDNSLLEILWSDQCQAGWGRVTRYDEQYEGNTVTIAIFPETAPDGPARQEATEHDVQGAYTFLVVRPSRDTLLCVEGSYTVDGAQVHVGDSLCI